MTVSAIPMIFAAFSLPFRLEYFSWLTAALLFCALGATIVLLGIRSLSGMTGVRKWVIVGVRLAVLLTFVLLLGGMAWERKARDVEVYCVRDASDSTTMVQDYPGKDLHKTLQRSLDTYFMKLATDPRKEADDRIGVIGFRGRPTVEWAADRVLSLDGRGIPVSSSGTDAAAALQMALATMSPDAMHRILLVWDGNQTTGDIDSAVAQAAAMHIPIDVFPLEYNLQNEIMVERMEAPSWRRENESFMIKVYIRSTNPRPVTGKLIVSHETRDGDAPFDTRSITLQPGMNVAPANGIKVQPLTSAGVHRFHAEFVPDEGQGTVDTIHDNNTAEAFTVVRGKGQILYVNNFRNGDNKDDGKHLDPKQFDTTLLEALQKEKIDVHMVPVSGFPNDLIHLQEYDAVILDNVPRGSSPDRDDTGLSIDQDAMLARYVNDFGGGLVMIGGEHSFGAGGWLGSEVEKILPVDMDIPAQRQVGKGALVLIMDPGEIPEGRSVGEECAFKAIEALSAQDEVGIIDYNFSTGLCEWVLPLQEKGDGSQVRSAIRKMHNGDLPNFDEALQLVLTGDGARSLLNSDARHKHVIIISDGDSMPAAPATLQALLANKISVSTVTAFAEDPSDPNVPAAMSEIARVTLGKKYGPINSAPEKLPQIFIKEAQIVRRTLIQEDKKGIPVFYDHPGKDGRPSPDASDDIVKGVALKPVYAQVLVTRKKDPRVQVPLVTGALHDPVVAYWQSGLGKSAVFTSAAHGDWGWAQSNPIPKEGEPDWYSAFWAQVVRNVARHEMASNFNIDTRIDGTRGHIQVTAYGGDMSLQNFLTIGGSVVGPDMKDIPVELSQTAPGVYEGDFAATEPGTYVAGLHYNDRSGRAPGMLVSGATMDKNLEMRDLQSNNARLDDICARTGGRRLTPWDVTEANIFSREGLYPVIHAFPAWDTLLKVLMGLIVLDVALRRLAWDWQSIKRAAGVVANKVRSFTTLRRGDALGTLAVLKDVRHDVLKQRTDSAAAQPKAPPPLPERSNPAARFNAAGGGVEGNITDLVSGAKDAPIPAAKPNLPAKPGQGRDTAHTDTLLDAKRRARERIRNLEGPDSGKPGG